MNQPVSAQPKQKDSSVRLSTEQATVRSMLELYCHDHHQLSSGLCEECTTLWQYIEERLGRCPFQQDKPTCLKCTVHCYKPAMRERIREVMRYAGPRMALRHPILSVLHWINGRRTLPSGSRKGTP